MGIYLGKPNTHKESDCGENDRLQFSATHMQGWRVSMEDAHIAEPNFDKETSLFAVFDGHGGKEVALFCS